LEHLVSLDHECKEKYLKEKEKENKTVGQIPLEDRVSEFLEKHRLPESTI